MAPIDPQQTLIAYHEAGHAFSAVVNGLAFSGVWIIAVKPGDHIADGVTAGQVTRNLDRPSFFGRLEAAKLEVIQAIAGPIAECLPTGTKPDFDGNPGDMNNARAVLRFAFCPHTINAEGEAEFKPEDLNATHGQIQAIFDECLPKAVDLVRSNIPAIVRIANALIAKHRLTPDEVRALVYPPTEKKAP